MLNGHGFDGLPESKPMDHLQIRNRERIEQWREKRCRNLVPLDPRLPTRSLRRLLQAVLIAHRRNLRSGFAKNSAALRTRAAAIPSQCRQLLRRIGAYVSGCATSIRATAGSTRR